MNKQVLGFSLLLALLAGCSEKQDSQDMAQLPLDIEAGKAVAQKNCAICHGMDGRGAADNIPNLAAQLESYLLKAVQTYDHGKRVDSSGNVMKIAEELTHQQLRDVSGFYASLPPLAKPASEAVNYSYYDRGQALSKPCASCHGADGNTEVDGVPRLAGQHPQYITKALKAYRDGVRTMPSMHATLSGLSQADIENIAIYFALNEPKSAGSKASNSHEGMQFISTCVKCHGTAGYSDDVSVPNLAGQNAQYLNKVIKSYRDSGRDHKQMHQALSGLRDEEISKIATFFATELPVHSSFTPPETIQSLVQKCDLCHSKGDANPEMLTPKINGQNRTYLINAMTTYRDGDRGNSAMHTIGSSLYFDATIEGLAEYYSAQEAK
ncbi:MAG: cytochrome c4 [Nitrosomonadales bacterium]|nr:cytochrome c4 [Nitrosomonadales bacterium]